MRLNLPLQFNKTIDLKTPLHFLFSTPPPRFRSTNRTIVTSRNVPFPLRILIKTANQLPLRFRGAATMATLEDQLESKKIEVKTDIELTEKEKMIFDRLLGTVRHFNLQTQLRVAGGWVRDKMLGKDCCDIDIALEDMVGSDFVEKVSEYLSSTGEKAQGVAVIASNPDQSKHLETARMRLLDLWIDFVNLRCEEYCDSSRIPTMKFGTPEQDAYRRDLTINSLFYNVETRKIEDYTKRGIDDLKSGKIVTPLPPKETFLDDPLRVLRAIRFGARFDFILDEELKQAAACDNVKAALAEKISKERIGTEIDLMISGNRPVKAITYIYNLTIFWTVFTLPSRFEPVLPEECHRLCIAYMDFSWSLLQLIGSSTFNDEERRLSLYTALFLPLRDTIFKDNKAKKIPVVSYIIKDSLKRKTSDADAVMNIHKAVVKFLLLIPSLLSDENIELDDVGWATEFHSLTNDLKVRILTGFLLREIKDYWRVALLTSMLLYPKGTDNTQLMLTKNFELNKAKELFSAVENRILKLGLDKIWEAKPLINGKDIMNVLQLKSGGPLVREWQEKLVAWQLAYPGGTREECLDWMKETHSKRIKMK